MTTPTVPYVPTPQSETGATSTSNTRGIASLSLGNKYIRFRTNPNEMAWTYSLNTKVEQTYGGWVVQILSTKMDDLVVKVDCGRGGWPYLMQVCKVFRDILIEQRGGDPATFQYTTRGWKLKVFAQSIPFQDQVDATVRELVMTFKVQEDVSGVMTTQTLNAELARLQEGIGFTRNQYNTPGGGGYQDFTTNPSAGIGIGSALGLIPGLNLVTGIGTGLSGFLGGLGGLGGFGLGGLSIPGLG